MESTKLPNIDLGQAKPQTSIKQVADTPRKGRSSNLLPPLISEEGSNTSRTERNRISIENQRANELLERNQGQFHMDRISEKKKKDEAKKVKKEQKAYMKAIRAEEKALGPKRKVDRPAGKVPSAMSVWLNIQR